MSARNILLLILSLFVIAGVISINATPYRTAGVNMGAPRNEFGQKPVLPDVGAPDERQHANYVAHLLDGKGFPVMKIGDGEQIEFHQPPLYYLMSAGFSKISGANPVEASGKTLRFLNLILGCGTLTAIYFAGLWGLRRAEIALCGAVIAGLMPMFVGIHTGVNNDPLLICICSWVFALCVRLVGVESGLPLPGGEAPRGTRGDGEGVDPVPSPSAPSGATFPSEGGKAMRTLLLIGLLFGLGMLTKSSALALAPILLMTGWWIRDRVSLPLALSPVLVGLLIASPWLLRNNSLYGDPLALKLFEQAFTGTAQTKDLIAMVGANTYWTQWFGWWTARSFVGVFGYMDIFMSDTVYRIALVILAILGVGWVFSFREKSEEASTSRYHWLGGVFALFVALLYLKFNLTYFQAQARYLYPAIGPIALALGGGLVYLVRQRTLLIPAALAAVLFMANLAVSDFQIKQFEARVNEAKSYGSNP